MNNLPIKVNSDRVAIKRYLGTVISTYLSQYRGQSWHTYRDAMNRFTNHFGISGNTPINEIEIPDGLQVKLYQGSLLDQGLSPHTINIYITVVRGFYGYLLTWVTAGLRVGAITSDQAIKLELTIKSVQTIKNLRTNSAPARSATTPDQARELLDSIGTESNTDLRDRAMISLLIGCGLRRIEIARAYRRDLSTNGQVILHIQQKGHHAKDGIVVIHPGVERELRAWLSVSPFKDPDSPLFPSLQRGAGSPLNPRSISRIIRRRLDKVGLNDQSTHSLRHAFATIALQDGADIREVQSALGHQSVATTERYVHHSNRLAGVPERIVNDALF